MEKRAAGRLPIGRNILILVIGFIFIIGYAVAPVVFVPGILLTLAAGAIFGLFLRIVCVQHLRPSGQHNRRPGHCHIDVFPGNRVATAHLPKRTGSGTQGRLRRVRCEFSGVALRLSNASHEFFRTGFTTSPPWPRIQARTMAEGAATCG